MQNILKEITFRKKLIEKIFSILPQDILRNVQSVTLSAGKIYFDKDIFIQFESPLEKLEDWTEEPYLNVYEKLKVLEKKFFMKIFCTNEGIVIYRENKSR